MEALLQRSRLKESLNSWPGESSNPPRSNSNLVPAGFKRANPPRSNSNAFLDRSKRTNIEDGSPSLKVALRRSILESHASTYESPCNNLHDNHEFVASRAAEPWRIIFCIACCGAMLLCCLRVHGMTCTLVHLYNLPCNPHPPTPIPPRPHTWFPSHVGWCSGPYDNTTTVNDFYILYTRKFKYKDCDISNIHGRKTHSDRKRPRRLVILIAIHPALNKII
jgi:hypothetical protein